MIKITKELLPFDPYCEALHYQPENCIFFDIETTGLSAVSASVFLIGAILRTCNSWKLIQWFAEDSSEEPFILEDFLKTAASYDTILHFNGTTFDLPFLKARAGKYGIYHSLSEMCSIDLYQKLRPLKKMFSLERLNQTSLEKFLGWEREDRLTGKHMIDLYKKYTLSHEKTVLDLLLLHNHDDMLGMTKLLSLSAFLLLRNGELRQIDSASVLDGHCQLSFLLKKKLPVSFETESTQKNGSRVRLTAANDYGILYIPLFEGELRYFFADYKNYYYLPMEDQAIHKSIGAYVDKEHRCAAKPSNCYTRKTGRFLPQAEAKIKPAFKRDFSDKQTYFELTDDLLLQTQIFQPYAEAMVKSFFS